MSLALMVTASEKVPRYIQDVVLLHVAGVALLTLLINATTTGMLVKALGLSRYSDLKKNILIGLTYKLEQNNNKNIEILRNKRHFNAVEWPKLKESIKMINLQDRLKRFKHLHLEGDRKEFDPDQNFDKMGRLQDLNEKIAAQ